MKIIDMKYDTTLTKNLRLVHYAPSIRRYFCRRNLGGENRTSRKIRHIKQN